MKLQRLNVCQFFQLIRSSNWTSISTGAWPRTHGVIAMVLHLPGTPLTEVKSGFYSDLCQTINIFKRFLVHNHIKDKQIPNSYPQLQGKVEAYNEVMKNEFLALEDIPNIDEGKLRYDLFVKAYTEVREHGSINGLTPSEVVIQRLITSAIHYRI